MMRCGNFLRHADLLFSNARHWNNASRQARKRNKSFFGFPAGYFQMRSFEYCKSLRAKKKRFIIRLSA
jgi:hypothetical protein